jgi:hypothetical protein
MMERLDVTEAGASEAALEDQEPGRAVGFSWGALSPEAEKARREAAVRARGYWPRLSRTSDKAIVQRPRYGGRRQRVYFADNVSRFLPQFRFNSKRNWWEAPLGELEAAYQVLQPVNLSDGARDALYRLGMEV